MWNICDMKNYVLENLLRTILTALKSLYVSSNGKYQYHSDLYSTLHVESIAIIEINMHFNAIYNIVCNLSQFCFRESMSEHWKPRDSYHLTLWEENNE